jgi:hypothetical protein
LFAGPIAQRKFQPTSFRRRHAQADYDQIAELGMRVTGTGEIATAFARWLEPETKAAVALNWKAINRVAAALVEHRTLDGEALQAAFEGPQQDLSSNHCSHEHPANSVHGFSMGRSVIFVLRSYANCRDGSLQKHGKVRKVATFRGERCRD